MLQAYIKLREWIWIHIRSKTIHIIPETKHGKPKTLKDSEEKLKKWVPSKDDFEHGV